ncbi:MAG: UvrD-helicase domain-containing protein [Candidatus Saccharimonadales bacterium]
MNKNRLLLSAPGSGKTTLIVNEILAGDGSQTLITTYTESNAEEIKQKFISKRGSVPGHVTILPWFSFLLKHGVRPYQFSMDSSLEDVKIGFYLQQGKSGRRGTNRFGQPLYWGEEDFKKFYFTKDYKIYSDKISKFIYTCNKGRVNGEVVKRISRMFTNIYVDEVQDLAGWDLELILLFFKSESNVTLVGDPRQTIYATNDGGKHKTYRGGRIDSFLKEKGGNRLSYHEDTETLKKSHRNNRVICDFSSLLFPDYSPTEECSCDNCVHTDSRMGIFLVHEDDLGAYKKNLPNNISLRWSGSGDDEMNFGISKGKTFDHVIIRPTEKMIEYLKAGDLKVFDSVETLSKLYVAITRARFSVAFIYDHHNNDHYNFQNMSIWDQ